MGNKWVIKFPNSIPDQVLGAPLETEGMYTLNISLDQDWDSMYDNLNEWIKLVHRE